MFIPLAGNQLTHIVVKNFSKTPNSEIAYWVDAVNFQLKEHVAPMWDKNPPGVIFYDVNTATFPDDLGYVAIVDDDGREQANGYHTVIGRTAYGFVDVGQADEPSRTLSHEVLEMYVNPNLTRWVQAHDQKFYSVEICDAVQRSQYFIETNLWGLAEPKQIMVSNFVTPNWYGDMIGPYDYLRQLAMPFDIQSEGYAITSDKLIGKIQAVDAANKKSGSRTSRLFRK